MTWYVETYDFAGFLYGIEQSQIPEAAPFKCWWRGCSLCRGHRTLEEARQHIKRHAIRNLKESADGKRKKAAGFQDVINALENDPMQAFRGEQ